MIKRINLDDIRHFTSMTKKEGMAGFSERAEYYGYFFENRLCGFTSIQFYGKKAKFNNHYVFKEYRGIGIFKAMFEFSYEYCKEIGCQKIVAACTAMSLPYYLSRGAKVVKEYKICTNVELDIV
jgi:GNAT superfamily N-acetyltransferase